ncbi:MAG: replication initiation factor domain-containing protein [Bacteroidetes bacterium]|uniref:hypothetical protein n=1 Tax=Phnomibacter sp. TaxID=2836217 RepID=UPI002FDCD07E|nr:replication initiation factor domain-containing protein [Bacteroidota bacterium]
MQIEQFYELIPPQDEVIRVVPVIDWLSFNMKNPTDTIPHASSNDTMVQISDNISLKYYGSGTQHYKYRWHVLYQGEDLATLLSHTVNEKFVKRGMCKLDIKNHLLYTGRLWEFYHALAADLQLEYVNISRLDIAIDGLNYLLHFVNEYVRQTAKNKVVELKGRGRFKSNLLDRPTMLYNSFQLGSPKSKKEVTIYNKSQELVKSQKDYIQRFWVANGIAKELLPLQLLAKAMSGKHAERYHIEGYENVYRFEMRLYGELVKSMQGFTLDWLKTGSGLMSIVKRNCQNFFEFVEYNRTDTSKCKTIDLIPFHQFDCIPIEIQRIIRRDDLYKTKLSIKKNVHQLYLGILQPSDYSAAEMLVFDVNNYELKDWYSKKIIEWHKEYQYVNTDASYTAAVWDFLTGLHQRFTSNTEGEILI